MITPDTTEGSAYIDARSVEDMLRANNAHLQVILQRQVRLMAMVEQLVSRYVSPSASPDVDDALLSLHQREAALEVQAIYLKMTMDSFQ